MISYEAFGDRVEAHLSYARELVSGDAFEVLGRRLDDATWKHAPESWINTFRWIGERATPEDQALVTQLLDRFVSMLTTDPIGAALHRSLPNLVMWDRLSALHLQRVSNWLHGAGTPSEASLVADVLWHVLAEDDEDKHRAVLPLVKWIIEHGAAELRARRRGFLVYDMVRVLISLGEVELLAPALRYMFACEQPPMAYRNGSERGPIDIPLDAMERLLTEGLVPATIVAEFARALPEAWVFNQILVPDRPWIDRPATRTAVVEMLLGGHLKRDIATEVWQRALLLEPSPNVRFATEEVLELSSLAARDSDMGLNHRPNCAVFQNQRSWAQHIARAWLQAADTSGFDEKSIASILRLIGRSDPVGLGVQDALRTFLEGASSERHLASREIVRELHEADGLSHGRLRAALMLLVARPTRIADENLGPWLDDVRQLAERVFQSVPTDSVLGRMLGSRSRVTFAPLAGETKFEVTDTALSVDPVEMTGLARAGFSHDDSVLLGAMYVVHEAIHLVQHIGNKADVARLRATGAETTLMQIDLAADHLAARLVASATDHSLAELKDLQGRALAAFPVGPTNTTAARARKAYRLVGLRLDFFLRASGVLSSNADEHVFADFGPVGPWLVVLASGPPVRVVGIVSLPRAHAERLSSAADARAKREEIDEILRRCAARLPLPAT